MMTAQEYAEQIRKVRGDLRLLEDTSVLEDIETVLSIVSSSRAGSSVFKWALSQHPEVCCLNGEEEPYYKLAENGYPWHPSDEFHSPKNLDLIKMMIATELSNHELEYNRMLLQYSLVEEPPFVKVSPIKVKPTLVLKTPQNIYRKGVLERLFPGRRIVYIHLTRSYAPTVNGLIDGWTSNDFKARMINKEWWKFDMPPGWNMSMSLLDRCVWQWQSANRFGLSDYSDSLRIKFEDFIKNPWNWCNAIWTGDLSLSKFEVNLPLEKLMTTDDPKPFRWKRKRKWLISLSPQCEPLMTALGYSMDSETWE